LKSNAELDWSLGEQRPGVLAAVSDSSGLASGGGDRSVFEKGFEMLCFDPEAAALAEDVALAGSVDDLVDREGTTDFAVVTATRFIAARPLAEI
jgi:hypothetical protein